MRDRYVRFLFGWILGLLLCAAGCSGTVQPPASAPNETPSPSAAAETPTPQPTPVTVAGSRVENGVLRAVVQAQDFAVIETIPDLHTLDVSGSTCYDAIVSYRDAHPETQVIYTVAIGDAAIPHDAVSASLPPDADISLLRYLDQLKEISVTEAMTPAQTKALRDAAEGLSLRYAVSFAGLTVESDATALDLSDVSPEKAGEIAEALSVLPDLNDLSLNRSDGGSAWTLQEAGVLQAVRPEIRTDLNVSAFGVSFSLTDEIVSFSGKKLSAKTDELTALLPYMRSVKRLDMEDCGIPDETMAALREQFPSPKIVWRVHVGYYACRTDAVMIHFAYNLPAMAIRDKVTHGLIYCNEVKYLDLGHNLIQDPYFVAYMPDLEVCVISINQPTDLSAFACCPHLEYAELFNGSVTDVSPLASCKELKHLNLSMNQITDITPLYGLTQLERLWISDNPIPEEQIARFKELVPDCIVYTETGDPTRNAWRYDDSREDGYAERYALLRKQLMYDAGDPLYSVEEPDLD